MSTYGPRDLAEAVGRGGHACGIPETHDRLDELHYRWHEVARNYHEPREFRWSLGAFLQAARSVSFMLQAEKARFDDFSWYDAWVENAKESSVLRWVNDARVQVVHVGSLAPSSWVEFRCIFPEGDWRAGATEDEPPLAFRANPFVCTHVIFARGDAAADAGGDDDHPHEIERHWELSDVPGREVLDLCAEVYEELEELVVIAHARLGQRLQPMEGDKAVEAPDGFPCMTDTARHRIARFEIRDGERVWENEPPALHSP